MTTRETYFKAYMTSDKSQGMFYYSQLMDDVECLRSAGWFDLNQAWHEKNIEIMQKLEKQEGFMFWNCSTECQIWLEKHDDLNTNLIQAFVFVQRDGPYKELEDMKIL